MAVGDAPGAAGARAGAGERVFVAALLAVFAALAILSMRVKNPTFDETAHLAAGVSYVQKRDFRMNPEHPVLTKLIAGAAAGLAGARHSGDTEAWRDAEQWDFAREVLYDPGADWRRILFAGRLPMVAIGVALGLATWAWTRAMAGPTGAAVALALYAFCPNFLAHARLVTTDVPLALAVVGASACLWAAWRGGRIGWTLAAAGCVGVSMVMKFSAFSFGPAWLLLAVLPSAARPWRRSLAHAGVFAVAALVATELLVSACYGLALDWTTIRSLGMEGRGVSPASMSLLRRIPYEFVASVPWPSPAFAAGLKDIILFTEAGHPVFLLGMRGDRGWWWGPFATLAVKTSLPFLALVAAAAVTIARARFLRRRDLVFLGAVPIVVLVTNVAANLGLGVRHLLPMFPFLMALVGWSFRGGGFRGGAYSLAAALALLGWHAAGTVAAHPHYLPFFNEIARLTGGGARWLGDSNLDWGQDLSAAAERLRARGANGAILCYFGTASPFAEDLEWQILPPAPRAKARDPWTVLPAEGPQWLAMSVTNQQGIYYRGTGEDPPMPWLDDVEPVETVGGTIRLYEISHNVDVQRGLAEIYRRHGLVEEAKRALIRAVRESPYEAPPRQQLIAAWLAEGALKEAEAVILGTRNPTVQEILQLASVRKQLGDAKGVLDAYEAGLRGYEYEPDVRNEFAWWLQETGGDLDRALELAQRAVELRPSDPYYLDTLAMVRLKRFELADALDAAERALEFPGGDIAAIRWHRALVLAELRRGGEAVAEAERILARDDLSPELEEEVGRWLLEAGR